jgi:hypothetical protein
MNLARWNRFKWDVTKLPAAARELPAQYAIRLAAKEEGAPVRKVVFSAFSLDADWGDVFRSMEDYFESELDDFFNFKSRRCLVLTHGARIIGVSLLSTDPAADNHLVTGPCILHEYRNRGFGGVLLHRSLVTLRDAGLAEVNGVTRRSVPAGKFLYAKYGSTATPCDFGLQLTAS